ncbi:uncharacterized protein A1O9_06738 [Exophiala aquamarina CBS 119918]|uniref:cyclic pyranopterin monophosphate synthase n=1 Tax=Exophiala aquamarina CBS 119918 TaxID=1182545 RepID=A0A072PLY2_9EURO|nr:uncharacterized protein A1O9_06738 [Exophiala aquamarina CBS 119918]KEF56550.1 hypothetical protein A1O9_06738 [Exophiala aquamarina CBS 119918]
MPLQLLQNPSHGGSYSQTRLLSTGSSATHQPRQARSTVVRTINGQAVWRRIAVKPFPFLKWKRIPVLPDARTSSPPSRLHLSEPVSTPPPPPTRPSFSKTTENESEKSWASSNIQPLNHLNTSGEAHMVSIANKIPTTRSATARSLLLFSTPTTYQSLVSAQLKKGDAVAVARIAGIQAAKKTSDLIPLAHPSLAITGLNISIEPYAPGCEPRDNIIHWRSRIKSTNRGGVYIQATVDCEGKTGVEMEAMMAASVAGLTMYDMLKGVDKAMKLTETQVIKKSGGKSGDWSYDYTSRRIVETVGKGGSSGVEKPSTGRRGARRREGTSSGEERVTFDSEAPSQEPQKQEIQPSTNTDESADIKPIIEQPQGEETPAMPSADIKPIIEQRQEDESQSMPSGNHTATTSNINNTETNTSSQKEEPFKPRNHVIKDHVLIRQHEIEHGRLVPADSISPADDVRTILAEATAIDSEVSSVHDETYERAMAVVKRGYVTANDLRNARIRDWLKRSLDHGIEIPLGPAR